MLDEDWWTITAIHEAAHGIVAFALDCHPVELTLNRRMTIGQTAAGQCGAPYERTCYGMFAKIFVANAPFLAHQIECLPCGEKGDVHERGDAYTEFCKLTGHKEQALFFDYVDKPLYAFFNYGTIQAAVLTLANKLYIKNRVSMKQVNYWREQLNVPPEPCEALQKAVMRLAQALADSQ